MKRHFVSVYQTVLVRSGRFSYGTIIPQWPKEKGQKDKLLSTKHTYKVTRTLLETGGDPEGNLDICHLIL
jgi:hypothetical protein